MKTQIRHADGIPTLWEAASNGANRRHWFVMRYLYGPGVTGQCYETSRGTVRRYASMAAAQRVADRLNRTDG